MVELDAVFEAWEGRRVLVVGDIMVDVDLHTKFTRFSSEFDGKVYLERERIHYPGGAANVAQICASLGAMTLLMGPLAADEEGMWLRKFCRENYDSFHYVGFPERPYPDRTTVKTRLFQDKMFVCRIDRDVQNPFPINNLRRQLAYSAEPWDALLLSDYRKGCFANPAQISEVVKLFKKHSPQGIVGLNPKPESLPCLPCGIDLISVNNEEFQRLCRPWDSNTYLLNRLGVDMLLHTQGAEGLTVMTHGRIVSIPVQPVKRPDVVGCGDATFAAAVLARTVTDDEGVIAALAAAAGTSKAKKTGTVGVTSDELRQILVPHA